MQSSSSIPPTAKPKSCAPKPGLRDQARRSRRRRAFNLVEVVIAVGITSFALLSILGVMAASLSTHQNANNDSVLTLMTETAVQEMRNYAFGNSDFSGANAPYASTYGFTNVCPATATATASVGGNGVSGPYYIYFDVYGEVTADGSNGNGYEIGNLSDTPSSPSVNSLPTTTKLTSNFPTGTVYQCTITPYKVMLPGATNPSGSICQLVLTFSWPVGAPTANQKTRVVHASISNPAPE